MEKKILGAVGVLQIEVVKFRLEDEYGVKGDFEAVSLSGMRWLKFKDKNAEKSFKDNYKANIAYDVKGRLCYCVKSDWDLKLCQERNPDVEFFSTSEF